MVFQHRWAGQPMQHNLPEPVQHPDRWTLIRDILVLQFKLVVDGVRDFLLVPASLIVGIVSLFSSKDGKPGPQFYRLLGVGKRSEQWINLFGAYRHSPESISSRGNPADANIDDFVNRMESLVVEEYKRGGVTAQTKKLIDDTLDAIQRRARNKGDRADKP